MKYYLAFTVALLLLSCSKYEDNEKIALRTKKARLVGSWQSERIEIDDLSAPSGTEIHVEFEGDSDFNMTIFWNAPDPDDYTDYSGQWEFKDKKSIIQMIYEGGSEDRWEILRLERNDLWVDVTFPNLTTGHIYIEFEKD